MTSPTLALLFAAALGASEPPTIPLWPNGAPGFESRRDEPEEAKDYWVRNIHNPSVTVFLPPKEKATGAAVVVCPGGGHRMLVYNAEGAEPAKFLNDLGVAAFVLKHRLPRQEGSPYKLDVHPREDGLRAMRLVRSRASEWGIDPNRIGFLGFSAGGEVASMVAFGPNAGDPSAADPIDRVSARPDFLMEVYPGPLGIPEVVPKDAPPAFLIVANDDGASRNILALLQKYRDAKVPVEAHFLAQGGHGFNMGNRSKLASVKTWPQRLADWLNDNGFLAATKPVSSEQKEAPVIPPRKGESKTIHLFDGKTLDGWEGYSDLWSVKDGVIVAKNTAPLKYSTYLLTKDKYTDFRLTFSAKLVESEMHSGVAFWGEVWPQADGKVTDPKTDRSEYTYKGHLVMFPSNWGMYDLFGRNGLKVDPAPAKKVGKQHDWNDIEILAQGNRVRVAVNGAAVVDWRDPQPDSIKPGPIGLQLHSNTVPQEVHFKGLVLETFPKEDRLITVK